jgi:PKD repeat protein
VSITNTSTKVGFINVTTAPPPAPIADFTGTPTLVTVGLPVQFNDTSLNTPTSWSWNFGDSSGSTSQNPSHVYGSIGLYTVSLTATNAQGSDTKTRTNYINVTTLAPPVAGFAKNVSKGQSPLAVQFTDTSTDGLRTYVWTFEDDGSSQTVQNPVHTFTTLGNWTVTQKVSNSAGNSTATGYVEVVAPSGFNRQDLVMAPQFTLQVTFVDSATNLAIPVVRVVDSLGNNYTTSTGEFVGSYEYSNVVLYCYSDGYTSRAVSYIMDENRVETVQLVKASTSTSSTWYTPKTIQFSIVDVYGNDLNGAIVNANYNSTTLPKGLSDLINNYGMNSESANDALNGTLVMTGSTDTSGNIVFTMLSTIKYDVNVTYNGQTNYYSIYPQDSQYQLKFIVPVAVDNIWDDLYANGNTKVWATEPDIGNVTFWWSFQDITALTTRIDFYLKDSDLGTIVYMTNITSPVAGGIYQLNYTVPNVRGKNYVAWENYTRSV